MQVAATPPQLRVGLPTKLAYGLGSIAYGIKDTGFSTLLLLFYNLIVGLPAGLVGTAILIALVLDAIVDPIIGQLSDHTTSRWGRRHPFMYASAIPVGVLYFLLWTPPTHASHAVTLAYLIVVAVLLRTAISCYEIPSAALAPELTADYHERTSVLGYRYLFGWAGGIAMLLVTFGVFLAKSTKYPIGVLNPAGYRHYAVLASLTMAATILLSAFGTHREIARLPKASPSRANFAGTWRAISGVLRYKPFLILMVAGAFSFTNQGVGFALGTYFNTFFWQFPSEALFIFTAFIIVGVILAFFLASLASRHIGKRRAAVFSGLFSVVVSTLPLLLRLGGWFPANGSPILLPLLLTTTTVGVAVGVAGAILGASMMSDLVEDAQARRGERTEGLFFAGSFFIQKCASGLGLFLSGAILTLARFPAAATPATVTHEILSRVVISYCALTAVLGIASALVLARFPIGEADHRRSLAALAEAASRSMPLPGSEPQLLRDIDAPLQTS